MSKVFKALTKSLPEMIFGKKVGGIISGVGLVAIGIISGNPMLIMAGLGKLSSALRKQPKVNAASIDRLTATLEPHAPRKIVFGRTAMATDVRYQATTGDDQEYLHWIVCVAAHEVNSIDEIWFDTEKAWTLAGGVESKYAGYLDIAIRNPGTSANGIAIDATWTATCTLTGCPYFHARFRTHGIDKKAESPFAQSVPTRITVVGNGALLPELREGGVDVDDQSTWDWFDADSGRSLPMMLLFFLIGWRINGVLSVGCGMPSARIDLDSFITAANLCDETVSLAVGGTEPRYRGDGIFDEGQDPQEVMATLCGAMNAVLRDDSGKLSLHVLHNDLADPDALTLGADNIIGAESWKPVAPLDEMPNIVRGRCVDASEESLYQLTPEMDVSLASVDGIDRIDPFDLAVVQSFSQWQRLAKQRLQRAQYQGRYIGQHDVRAWGTSLGRIVKKTHPGLGWTDELFRTNQQGISPDGVVLLVLEQENAAIYAWDEEESPPVVAAVPIAYNPLNNAIIQGIAEVETGLAADIAALEAVVDGKITTFYQSGIPTSDASGDLWFRPSTGKWYIAVIAGADAITAGEWEEVEDSDIGIAILAAAEAQDTADGKIVTFYQDATPTAEGVGDLWVRPSDTPKIIKRWNGSTWVAQTPASLDELDEAAATALAAMTDDGLLSPVEKKSFIKLDGEWEEEYKALSLRVDAFGLTVPVENKFLRSEQFENAAWVMHEAIVTANVMGTPNGVTGDRIDLESSVSQDYTRFYTASPIVLAAVPHTFSIWLKGVAGGESFWLYSILDAANFDQQMVTLTRNWQRFSFTFTPAAGSIYFVVGVDKTLAGQSARPAQSFYAWGAQLNTGPTAFDYRTTTSAAYALGAESASLGLIAARTAYLVQRASISGWDDPDTVSGIPAPDELNATVVFYAEKRKFVGRAVSEMDSTTGLVVASQPQTEIAATAAGTVKTGELDRYVGFVASVGNQVVTSDAAWTADSPAGITASMGAATGILAITAMTAIEAEFTITCIYNGVTRELKHRVKRNDDAPETAGGGNPGTQESTSTFSGITSTSYGAAHTGILRVTAGTNGQVACTAPLGYKRTPGTVDGLTGMLGKWQWRVLAGSFADITTEIADTADAETYDDPDGPTVNFAGSIPCNMTKTGLTTGTEYEFQLLLRKVDVSGDVDNAYISSGSATATGS